MGVELVLGVGDEVLHLLDNIDMDDIFLLLVLFSEVILELRVDVFAKLLGEPQEVGDDYLLPVEFSEILLLLLLFDRRDQLIFLFHLDGPELICLFSYDLPDEGHEVLRQTRVSFKQVEHFPLWVEVTKEDDVI